MRGHRLVVNLSRVLVCCMWCLQTEAESDRLRGMRNTLRENHAVQVAAHAATQAAVQQSAQEAERQLKSENALRVAVR